MDRSAWVCVHKADHKVAANVIRGLLESEGIAVQEAGDNFSGAYPGLEWTRIRLFVDPLNLERAKRLIADYQRGSQDAPAWLCRACGESNAGTFEICWQCNQAPEAAG